MCGAAKCARGAPYHTDTARGAPSEIEGGKKLHSEQDLRHFFFHNHVSLRSLHLTWPSLCPDLAQAWTLQKERVME